jgi:hypothetical protein
VNRGRDSEIRIASEIVLRQDNLFQRLRFATHKPMPPIIERIAELNGARKCFELARERIETKITAADVQ